jgi:DNA-directed RNA polymerase specialized sigma24 family protein
VTKIVAAAIRGDQSSFGDLTERHRRELHVHCYRMLASFDEAEGAGASRTEHVRRYRRERR